MSRRCATMWPVSDCPRIEAIGEATTIHTRDNPTANEAERQAPIARKDVISLPGCRLHAGAEHDIACSLAGLSVPCGTQRLEKCDQRRRFRRTQVLSVGRHIAPALNHL